jgi:predicted DNA-binding helix-hairpin-helix protein
MESMAKLRLMSDYSDVEQDGMPPMTVCGADSTVRTRLDPDQIKSSHHWEVFHAQMGGGKTIPLLKTMLSSSCVNDCNYCVFRSQRDFQRLSFSPDEMAAAFMQLVRKGFVQGLFLSSGITGSGVKSQDRLIDTVEIVRKKYHFGGYIHLKILPGAEQAQIERAMQLSNRVSINLEAPNPERLRFLAPRKDFSGNLLPRIAWMDSIRSAMVPAGGYKGDPSLTTQLVMGAAGENDIEMLTVSELLYSRYHLARVYYSRFNPGVNTPLENLPPAPFIRMVRLYQASFLLRDYGFSMEEMPFMQDGFLPTGIDPKVAWAKDNLSEVPVELNLADREGLLRIPGIGLVGAQKIIAARREKKLTDLKQLTALGISPKRAAPFVLLNGNRPAVQLELPI